MIFEKSSTRTRLSFEAGIHQLGGHAVFLNTRDTQLGRGEPIEDAAQVISRMTDIIMIRTFGQEIIERFAQHSRVPVINGLTNEYHPCQVLADIFTYYEHRGPIKGKTVTWIGDANNMSYVDPGSRDLRLPVHISTPPGYRSIRQWWPSRAARSCVSSTTRRGLPGRRPGVDRRVDQHGLRSGNEARKAAFAQWCVNADLMQQAKPDALFMHCLPAHRGEEVSADVIDGAQSVVWDEAENRLHVQKALMEYLMLGRV
jgi:ornithine carbamoyltransferase